MGNVKRPGRAVAVAAVWLAALVAAWCAPADPPVAGEDQMSLIPSLQAYPTAEGLHLVLQVSNVTEEPIEINFSSGQTYDFVVRREGRQVWRWSEEMMFTQALRREQLPAGETWRFEETWAEGADARGDLEVIGMLTSSDHAVQQSMEIAVP
jgi:hypothetical protein